MWDFIMNWLISFSHRLVFAGNNRLVRQFIHFNDMHLESVGLFHYCLGFVRGDEVIHVKCYFVIFIT